MEQVLSLVLHKLPALENHAFTVLTKFCNKEPGAESWSETKTSMILKSQQSQELREVSEPMIHVGCCKEIKPCSSHPITLVQAPPSSSPSGQEVKWDWKLSWQSTPQVFTIPELMVDARNISFAWETWSFPLPSEIPCCHGRRLWSFGVLLLFSAESISEFWRENLRRLTSPALEKNGFSTKSLFLLNTKS